MVMRGDDSMEHQLRRGRRLLEELEHLSGSARQQRRRLKQLGGVSVDELALDFDAAFAPAAPDFPLYPESLAAQLHEIDDLLNRMSSPGKRGLWTVYSLVTAPEWRHVRRSASRAADSLRLLLESWQPGKEEWPRGDIA